MESPRFQTPFTDNNASDHGGSAPTPVTADNAYGTELGQLAGQLQAAKAVSSIFDQSLIVLLY